MSWLNEATVKTAEDKSAERDEKTRQAAKQTRDSELNNLKYDFGDGRVIQTRLADLSNIQIALQSGLDREWVMADNTVQVVTVTELNTALNWAINQAELIWATYMEALK